MYISWERSIVYSALRNLSITTVFLQIFTKEISVVNSLEKHSYHIDMNNVNDVNDFTIGSYQADLSERKGFFERIEARRRY